MRGDPVRGAALEAALLADPVFVEQAADEQARWDGHVLGGANYPGSVTVEELRKNTVSSVRDAKGATQSDGIDYPPNLDVAQLNFDEFHPLDHPVWTRRCREFYGGPRRHLEMWWAFKAHDWLHGHTLCKVGRHRPTTAFEPRRNRMRRECQWCWKPLGEWQPMDQMEGP